MCCFRKTWIMTFRWGGEDFSLLKAVLCKMCWFSLTWRCDPLVCCVDGTVLHPHVGVRYCDLSWRSVHFLPQLSWVNASHITHASEYGFYLMHSHFHSSPHLPISPCSEETCLLTSLPPHTTSALHSIQLLRSPFDYNELPPFAGFYFCKFNAITRSSLFYER